MPFGSEGLEAGIAIALSGGGFRATLFHLGSLWRLNEVGLLPQLQRISSVSGGSIAAGYLGKIWNSLEFRDGICTNFADRFVEPVRAFCRLDIDVPAIGGGVLSPFERASEILQKSYSKHLFGDFTLQDLPDRPVFIFNSTNLKTGRDFRLSKPYAGDYRIGLLPKPQFTLSLAVAASSAFPPFLSPVVIDNPGEFVKVEGADLSGPDYTRTLTLTDGGVYDNLALETVWKRYTTLLVSDAGTPFDYGGGRRSDWLNQSLRALEIATDQARGLRKRVLIDAFKHPDQNGRQGAYWGIDTAISDYELPDAMPCQDEIVAGLSGIRTRLNRFNDEEQGRLINWGYAVCDAALRKRAPQLLPANVGRPKQWPFPAQLLGKLD